MGTININYQNGALGGILPSTDYISAFMFDSTVLPSGFSASSRVKAIYSLQDAVNLGITNTAIGETAATGGQIEITAAGAVGDYIKVYVQPANHEQILLGSYTVKTGDGIDDIVTGLVQNININTASTLWTATASGSPASIVELTVPAGLGAAPNGADVITVTHKSGTTFTTDITDFSNGVGSKIDNMYYILETFFNANPTAKVWLGIYDFTSAWDATKIATMQTTSGGEIRQMGIWLNKGLDGVSTIISTSQTQIDDQASKHKPLSVVFALQPGTIATASDLISLRSLASRSVSVTISNAYGTDERGYNLKGITGTYPTDLGSVLGHVSRSKVSYSIAWVEKNITQFADTMLVTGEHFLDIEDGVIPSEIFTKGYIFERSYIGYSGFYFDNAAVADAFTSDFDSIQRSRTIDKAARLAYTALLPYLSSPVTLDPTAGTLSKQSIGVFTKAVASQLDNMTVNNELSGSSVFIDPTQNLLSTKNLIVAVTLVPVGSADTITVNIGYALAIG